MMNINAECESVADPSCHSILETSQLPTRQSSSEVSRMLSFQQNVHATGQTAQAIYKPTCQPTSQPTYQPTSQPTGQPTCQPSAHEENSQYHFEGGKLAEEPHT
jgi:PT repeat